MKKLTFIIVFLITFILGMTVLCYSDVDLNQCTLGNNLEVCKGEPLPVVISEKKIEKSDDVIVMEFFKKFVKVINQLAEEKEEDKIIVKTYFADENY